ncbi:MerR family transcriptional regulator [Kineosporia babensis]|uniref:MerR family transcriptional regulator n=1 Tax=Kineosporia babensis TaxID=499548 RepID=A0A9X1SVU1_9ACTN|nr:MerR family transcriptional regulator [Kineosporia babensis]MCD5314051.1 MerR family transcriptional regulator [Kineosporia babensis]
MSWSTRQLAEIAGTTVRAVRHYHAIGLLAEPERAPNGYKLYGTEHLLRLTRIRRLAELGMPLNQIAALEETEKPGDSLRVLDQELGERIARLELLQGELGTLLQGQSETDGLQRFAADLSDSDRALILVYSRIYSPNVMRSIQNLVTQYPRDASDREFDDLPPSADERTRARLVDELTPKILGVLESNPWLSDVLNDAPLGRAYAREIFQATWHDLYNAAQIDVMERVLRRRRS